MSWYDRVANRWEAVTGDHGGPFKRHVLNDVLLGLLPTLEGRDVLELGAGNGYFARFLARLRPARLVVTDLSRALLEIAQRRRAVRGAEYLLLDVGAPFPFEPRSFDLILATLVFNEVDDSRLGRALSECSRVLRAGGRLLATVLHPKFVRSLDRRGKLKRGRSGPLTMSGPKGLRLPVVAREAADFEDLLRRRGFTFERHEVRANEFVLEQKPGLRHAGRVPLAFVYDSRRA